MVPSPSAARTGTVAAAGVQMIMPFTTAGGGLKDVDVVVQSVEATDLAGPSQR